MTSTRTIGRTLLSLLLVASALTLPGAARPAAAAGEGYWLLAADGGVFTFGAAPFLGSTGDMRLNQPVVGMAANGFSAGRGYWLVAADGGVFTFGDGNPFYGSAGDIRLNRPVVGMAWSPTGGYWLVASDGGIFSFGNARFSGSAGDIRLNSPIVGMAATPTGAGYWLVAADGGVFTFGDAPFFGSAAERRPRNPVVGMTAHPDGAGYWVVAADGSLYGFGSAQTLGTLTSPGSVVGIASSPTGSGHWLLEASGAVAAFGDAPRLGSVAGPLNRPMIGIAALPDRSTLAESKQPGTYVEAADNSLAVTFQGGAVTRSDVAIRDCFCSQRLLSGIAVEGVGAGQRFVVRLTNVSGVRMRLPDGLQVKVRGRQNRVERWSFTITEPSLTVLDPGATSTLSVPVPAQADGDYAVFTETVVVLD